MKPAFLRTNRGRWLLAAGLFGLLVVGWEVGGLIGASVAAPIDVQLADIAGITLQPIPEGPTLFWNHPPTGPYSAQQASIEAAIPIPLPGPDLQPIGCSLGGDLIVHLRSGRDISYGPCKH